MGKKPIPKLHQFGAICSFLKKNFWKKIQMIIKIVKSEMEKVIKNVDSKYSSSRFDENGRAMYSRKIHLNNKVALSYMVLFLFKCRYEDIEYFEVNQNA